MVESYRDYFVRRKAPWLCGMWVAVFGDTNHRKSLGKADLPGTFSMVAWEMQLSGPTWGQAFLSHLPCCAISHNEREVSEDSCRSEVYPLSCTTPWRVDAELNLVLLASALIFPGIPFQLPRWHLSINVVQQNLLQSPSLYSRRGKSKFIVLRMQTRVYSCTIIY